MVFSIIKISMTTGQLLQQGKLIIQAGSQYELTLKENFPKGVYTLIINNPQQSSRIDS